MTERPWQQPLSEEAKADLARQFAALRTYYARMEQMHRELLARAQKRRRRRGVMAEFNR